MSTARRPTLVVVIALQGNLGRIREGLDRADQEGLEAFVLTSHSAKRSLESKEYATTFRVRVASVSAFPLKGTRGTVRRLVESAGSTFAHTVFRATRAARHRLQLPSKTNSLLEQLGSGTQRTVPRFTSALLGRLVEPLLGVIGFIATKLHHGRVAHSEIRKLMKENIVVGVACLDDASLLPGWVLSRRFPTLPVVAGFPDRWNDDVDNQRDLFESGSEW